MIQAAEDDGVALPLREGQTRSATVEQAVHDVQRGRPVITFDSRHPGTPGHVIVPASFASAEAVNFMATHARGLIYLALPPERCKQLNLRPVPVRKPSARSRDVMVGIEAREGVTTGISAFDRARTISVAIDPDSGPESLVHPGHVMPLRVQDDGVLTCRAPAEAAVDLARLAGLSPAGVLCSVMSDDGAMAGLEELAGLGRRHGLRLLDVEALIDHRREHEQLLERLSTDTLSTEQGRFTAISYREVLTGQQHLALVRGDLAGRRRVLVHTHRACLAGDVFRSRGCECRSRLQEALERIDREDRGVVLYLMSGSDNDGALGVPPLPCGNRGTGAWAHEWVARTMLRDLGIAGARPAVSTDSGAVLAPTAFDNRGHGRATSGTGE